MKRRHKSGIGRLKLIVILIIFAGILVGTLMVVRQLEGKEPEHQRGTLTSGTGQLERVQYNGVTYVHKPEVTSILFMGIDRDSDVPATGYRDGGQADFLMLMVIDHKDKKIRRLAIDRDTLADITVLTILGKPGGTIHDHISLSHGFGATDEERCGYTVKAVENLLLGEKVDLYVSINMDQLGPINDMLGGVTVDIDIDMTNVDPAFTQGATVTLQGEQAEQFVRARMTVGDGTNDSRMKRQAKFISAAVVKLRERVAENTDFIGQLYDSLGSALCTNMTRGRMVNEANRAWHYQVGEIERFEGVYGKDPAGFTQFEANEDSVTRWVLETFYDPE